MSKVYIPTTNIGKAHDADIYSICVTNPFTITVGGDGYIKLWSNTNPKKSTKDEEHTMSTSRIEPDVVKFVDKSGLHHVDAFYSVESHDIGTVLIISVVSFSGNIYFYQYNTETKELDGVDGLLTPQEQKLSFWRTNWVKSDDLVVSHRFIACDVKGDTYVWRFQTMKSNDEDEGDKKEEPKELELSLTLQGSIASTTPVVATCVDVSRSKGLIATGFANGTVIVSQLATLRPLYTFEGYGIQGVDSNVASNSVRTLQFSPAGTLLAVGNDSGSFGCVTLYETEYGERIGNLTVPLSNPTTNSSKQQNTINGGGSVGTFAHNGWVFNLCFSPSGELLASCGYDSKIRVWDIKTKERVSTLNISANDIEIEEDIMLRDEQGDSMKFPPVFDVKFYGKGVRGNNIGDDVALENESNEGLCCVCMDRSIRWFRQAGK